MDTVLSPPTAASLGSSWISSSIHRYVNWLEGRQASRSIILRRIPHLVKFGEFARTRGAERVEDLPTHIDEFVAHRVAAAPHRKRTVKRLREYERELRGPVTQMLVVLGYLPERSRPPEPTFDGLAVGFFNALREERGLRPATLELYRSHLSQLEGHLVRRGVDVASLEPSDIDAFIVALRERMSASSLTSVCSALRHLLRWLFREGRLSRDLSGCVGKPQAYRLATVPRSIPWADIERTLAVVDRQTVTGIRDYAMLLLIVLYGLRAREVAALTLDDVDWRSERLHVRGRKCGHSTLYPLSATAGSALLAYLRVRPETGSRQVFIQACSPYRPVNYGVVSSRAQHYLRSAGVAVRRPGSHTLRHSCAQRLVDADFSLKVIGDYLGHSVPSSTEIYTKVAIETLRKVALGNGEEVLCPPRR